MQAVYNIGSTWSGRPRPKPGRRLPAEAGLRDLGEHRLKDLSRPERIFQLVHPALASDFPPLATHGRRPNNLPTLASEFLGREAQLAAIRDLLEASAVRLVTLTGPGGIGKTRLALQAGADQIDRFEDGVFFVDLSEVGRSDGVFEAVARAVGLAGTSDERLLEAVKEQLRRGTQFGVTRKRGRARRCRGHRNVLPALARKRRHESAAWRGRPVPSWRRHR